ncbi:BatD family protein [Psychromonas sp.]|nr:BatD family protein [Psychromonas sp.]
MSLIQKCFTLVLLLLAISHPAFAKTQAIASVSSNQVFLGDIFILSIDINDKGSEYQLDTSNLVNDFTVYRPSRSEQSSYVNGDYTEQTSWSLRLQAKKTGTFTIPAFTLGSVKTEPITITVSQPGKQQQSTKGDSIFIENTTNKASVYLDQPVILNTKIFVSENIIDADVQPPALANADIERITSDTQQSQVVRNGIRYQVFSYQYQITPTEAGKVSITSPLLVGSIRKAVRVNEWQNSIIADPITIRGNNIDLTVKERPANFEGDWLVSEDVRLIENNDLQQQEYFVGDPITRSISLQIASLPMERMPEIKLNYDNALRYYPDQDNLQQGTANDLLYSQRTITHAIIASKSGELTLPEIKLPWWNSVTEQQEYAVLPSQTLTIKPAVQGTNNANYTQQVINQPTTAPAKINENTNSQIVDNEGELLAWKISTFTLLTLLILLIIYHLKHRGNTQSKQKLTKVTHSEDNDQYQQLLIALQQSQPNQTYACLLRYLQSQQSNITQIQQMVTITGLNDAEKQQLCENLLQLELACSAKTHQWDAKKLLMLVKLHHKATKTNQSNVITEINP